MLKRLELVGFKSFADKTRFDFAPGVTGIVGPNGSGKSNVVDAVRWILGEQSAKSLRGGEMADVIFNGSSSRKSLGLAEVTVTFDNSRRLLTLDADEVQLTRRVYRDGTGEYLINGQMARLKDFKEMFLGSGAGAGGYTIIAQGRVDELLQASTKDRREIFDEAAGISRFKAKKTETLRKLASVELNLTRSKDRLDSLDSQLRTLRMQAAKAQKYKEYSERLRELRVGLSVREYRDLSETLAVEQETLAALKQEVSSATSDLERLEQLAKELDWAVTRGEEALRHHETRLADARQQIAGFETTFKHERASVASLEGELRKVGRQRAELGYRLQAIEADAVRASAEVSAAEERMNAEQQRADEVNAALAAIVEQLAELDHEYTEGQERQFELVREAGSSRAAADATLTQVQRLQKEYESKRHTIGQRTAHRGTLTQALDGLSQADADVQARLAAARGRMEKLRSDQDSLAERMHSEQTRLEGLRVRQGDLRGRIDILEDLERSLEGLGAGVAAVWRRLNAESDVTAPAVPVSKSEVLGLVADLLTVPHDVAPFVELALGDIAQRFVVRSPIAVAAVVAAIGELPGRVGFVPLQELGTRGQETGVGGPGAGGRDQEWEIGSHLAPEPRPLVPDALAKQVRCDHPDCRMLPIQLLGRVLLADSLVEARALAVNYPDYRIVTRTGELLETDGTLTVGPFKLEAGLVSRKSELRELREQYRVTSELVARSEVELAALRQLADAAEGVIEAVHTEIALLSDEAGGLLQRIARQRQQVESLEGEIELLQQESDLLERQVQEGEAAWTAARMAAERAEADAAELTARLAELKHTQEVGEAERDRRQQAHTTAQVTLSRVTADRDRVHERMAQIDAELRKRKIEAVDFSSVEHAIRGRLGECVLAVLRASAGQAEVFAEKENRERMKIG